MRFFISLVECWWHRLSTQWKTANPENHINIIIVQQLSNMYLHKVKKSFSRAAKLQLIAISLRESFLYFTSIRSSHMNYFIYFTWCTYISDADKLSLHSMDTTTENHHIGCNSENVFYMVQCNLFPNTLYIGKPNDKWKTVWHARPKPTAVSGLFIRFPLEQIHSNRDCVRKAS